MVTAKILRGQPGSLWIEGDKLKARRRDYSEISCRNVQLIRRTRHLLMMGYMRGAGRPAWFVIPLRVFGDQQELDLFLAMLRNPQGQMQEMYVEQMSQQNMGADFGTPESQMREYIRFLYQLDGERWVRL